jgi:protein involved in polysaccharide export with SLBB domain
MKLKETYAYPAGPTAVFALIQDPAFRKQSIEATGGTDVGIDVEPSGDEVTITIVRSQKATKIPDFIKSFIGETVRVKQVEKWGAPDADGNREAALTMHVQGQPAGMEGHATLMQDGKGASFVVQGDVRVKVPFVGKKIEPFIAKVIESSLRHDVNAGIKHLS